MALLTKTNIDIWFREYSKQFDTTKKYVKSRGGKVRDIEPLSRAEFEIDFRSELEDNPGKSGSQIAKKMAKDDLYLHSYKTAKSLAKAEAAREGKPLRGQDIENIRLGKTNVWSEIATTNQELKNAGFSGKERSIIIGQQFYGSP